MADLELLDFLLAQPGANVLGRDKHGCTLLHWAVLRTVRQGSGGVEERLAFREPGARPQRVIWPYLDSFRTV